MRHVRLFSRVDRNADRKAITLRRPAALPVSICELRSLKALLRLPDFNVK